MTILAYANGFEANTYRTWRNTTVASASTPGAAARSGSYGLRMNPSAAIANLTNSFSPTGIYASVGRIYVKFPSSLPASDVEFMALGTTVYYSFKIRNSDSKMIVSTASETQEGPVVSADTWYRIDFMLRGGSGAAPLEYLDWSVDGTAYARLDDGPSYPAALQNWRLGAAVSQTMDVYYDDAVVIWNSDNAETADVEALYPLGEGYVKRLAPNGVGTHNNSASFGTSSGTIANSWQLIDDLPMDTASGYIEQTTIGATDYLEYTFEDLAGDGSEDNPRVVTAFYSIRSSGLASNNASLHVVDGVNDNEMENSGWLDSSSPYSINDVESVPLAGTGTDQYDPSGATNWTRSRVDALLLRWGYSTDVDSIPRLPSAHLEVEIGPAAADRFLQVSWAELEVPTAPRFLKVSWAELEAPDAPRGLEVSWVELETPDAPRSLYVSWAELQVPDAARVLRVSWVELETPAASRALEVSWVELEVPPGARALRVSWVELALHNDRYSGMDGWVVWRYTKNNRRRHMPTGSRRHGGV